MHTTSSEMWFGVAYPVPVPTERGWRTSRMGAPCTDPALCSCSFCTSVMEEVIKSRQMVCYVVLCYVMLCYVTLCYVVLRYIMLGYVML